MNKLSLFLLLVLCCSVWSGTPQITINRTEKAPVIDGKIDPIEWKDAARFTGFSGLTGKYMFTDTEFMLMYDKDCIYLAVKSSYPAQQPYKKFMKQDGKIWENDTVDIRFQRDPKKPESMYLFAGDPNGNLFQAKSLKLTEIKGNVRCGTWVRDSGEIVGGVESFGKTLWDYEMAIPFKTMEMETPVSGSMLYFNLMRNYSTASNLKDNRWTSWTRPTPGKPFGCSEDFAKIIFAENAPVVKMNSLGDLTGGNINFNGSIFNPGAKESNTIQTAQVIIPEKNKIALNAITPLKIAGKGTKDYSSKGNVYLKRSLDLSVVCKVTENGKILFENTYCYTALPAFHCELIPLFLQDKLLLKANLHKVSGLSPGYTVKASVLDKNQNVRIKEIKLLPGKDQKSLSAMLDVSKLTDGDYTVSIELFDKKVVAVQNHTFRIEPKPEWLGNKLGISEKVPAPYIPLVSTENSAAVWGRDYRFGNNLFPEQIVNQGVPMLTAPMEFRAVTDKGTVIWANPKIVRRSTKDTEAIFDFTADNAQLKLKGTICVEYDGFIRYDFELDPVQNVTVTSLALHIRPTAENSIYMRAYQFIPETIGYAAYLNSDGRGGILKKNSWVFSGTGWKWEKNFINYLWMGGDESGLTVAFDSDCGFNTTEYVQVLPNGDSHELKINFINIPTVLSKPLKYTAALQATPLKPMPAPEAYHFGYVFPVNHDDALKGLYAAACYAGLDDGCAYPGLNALGKDWVNRYYKNQKVRIFPDGAFSWAANDIPGIKRFRQEWLQNPYFSQNYRGKLIESCCRKGTFTDYLLYIYKQRFDDGARGLYHDGVNPSYCISELHGCGCSDGHGKFHPTAGIFDSRETFKRIYTMYKELSPDTFIFVHNAPITPIAAFADGCCEGESWTEDYSNMTEEQFRAGFAVYTKMGAPFNLYPFVSYSWRYPDLKAVTKPHEIIAITLTINTYPVVSGMGGDECIGLVHMYPIWEIMDEWFTTSRWIRYWDKKNPVTVSTSDLKAVVYLKKDQKKALVLISNIARKNVKGTFSVNTEKMFGDKGPYQITEIIPGVQKYDKKEGLSILKKKEVRPMSVNPDSAIPAEFHGRGIRFFEVRTK